MLKRYIFAIATILMLPSAAWAEVNVSTFVELQTALSGNEAIINITADITNASQLAINRNVTINGNGHTVSVATPYLNEDGTVNLGASTDGVFTINSGSIVSLNNMTVMGGKFSDDNTISAAIFNQGTLTLDHVTMTRCHRGLSNSGSSAVAVLTNCVLIRNAAKYGGGLLNEDHGQLLMDCCSFSENRTREWGGGAAENRSGGKMYMNNVTMSNNYCDEQGAINNNSASGTSITYIMNSTITGNVTKATSGAVALNQGDGQVYVVNSIITDNYYLNDDNLEDKNVVGGNYAYCVVGSNSGGTLTECQVTDQGVFQSYAETGLYTGSGTTPTFSHTTLIESNGQDIAPISPDGPAASGGTLTYFNYILDTSTTPPMFEVFMSYDKDGANTPLGDLPISDTDNLVTTNQDGSTRTTTAPIPIGSAELSSPATAYYIVSRGSISNGTMSGVSAYGDSYASETNITVTATPNTGYVLAGWDLNGSIRSTKNPYTFALTENTVVTPVFSPTSTTIVCSIAGYEGPYDNSPHSIIVDVKTPASGYTITYSTDGTNYSSTNPSYTNIGAHTVYFKVVADGYTDFSGSAVIKITQALTETAITVNDIVYNGNAQNTIDAVTVKFNGTSISNTNYTVEPTTVTETGVYTLTIVGRNNLTGVAMAELRVKKNMNTFPDDFTISDISTQIYDGANSVHPPVNIYDKGRLLTLTADYTVSYGANNTEGTTAGSVTINGVGIYMGSKTFTFAIVKEYFTEDGVTYHATSATTVSVGNKAPTPAIATTTTSVAIPAQITHESLTFQVTGIDDGAFTDCTVLRYIDLSSITGYKPSTLERTFSAAPFYGVPRQALVYLNGTSVKGENYVYKVGDGDFRCDVFKVYDDISGSQTGFTETNGYEWSFENIHPFTAKSIVNTRKLKAGQHYTVCLPYDLPIPTGMKAYTLNGANTANTLIGFKEVTTGTLTDYKPYVLIASEAGLPLGTTNATVPVFPAGITDATRLGAEPAGGFTMYGTMRYISGSSATNATYIMQGKDAQGVCQWKRVTGGDYTDGSNKACVLPMRAYIIGPAVSGGARQRISAVFTNSDGSATAVDDLRINADDADHTEVHDLQGRRVSYPSKRGVYIRNGRKIVLK